MLIRNLQEGMKLYRALDSQLRVDILTLLIHKGPMRVGEIARQLNIKGGVLTPHVRVLEEAQLIQIELVSGRRGMQKICSVRPERIQIDLTRPGRQVDVYEAEIGIGQYSAYEVYPTCGLARKEHLIGQVDDPRYFADPDRARADILWFSRGYVEYMLPNYLPPRQRLTELQIVMELSSEAPGYCDNWLSDIHFAIGGKQLGYWTSPGDFGSAQGTYNPTWWPRMWNQYGLLKLLSVNHKGSFIDGKRIGRLSLQDLNIQPGESLTFRLSVPADARHVGGLTLFGRSFGNYAQNIRMFMHYENEDRQEEQP